VKVTIAGKGGVGKTTISALLARELAERGRRTLVVDCDPNPNLAESFGLDSARLPRFSARGLKRANQTLALARKPEVREVAHRLWLLGGPPTEDAAADAVARGIAGVLLAEGYDAVVTDLGAGPQLTEVAVGGALNPADLCVVLSDGRPVAELTAGRIEAACRRRRVKSMRIVNRRGESERVAADLVIELSDRDRLRER
jgi:CO dehydrogenase maturation factor